MTETTLTEALVTVDYPQAGEVVTSPNYTIRIGTIEASEVEVSIDDGPLKPCRFSVGYWWYDWSDYLPGKHQIMVQAHTEDDQVVTSRQRVTVTLAPNEKFSFN